jgi:hypothetical protein
MMGIDIASTQQGMSKVGPIEEPQIPEFLPLEMMDRVLWKNRRNIRTHVSWYQNYETNYIQMSWV